MDIGEPNHKRPCLQSSASHPQAMVIHPASAEIPWPSPCLSQHQPYTAHATEPPESCPPPPGPPLSAPHANDHLHHAHEPYRQDPPPQQFQNEPRQHATSDSIQHPTSVMEPAPPPPSLYPSPPHAQNVDSLPHLVDDVKPKRRRRRKTEDNYKIVRVSQACDYCRQVKAKCDESKPCRRCSVVGFECIYPEPILKATDQSQKLILEGIAQLKSIVDATFARFDERISNVERSYSSGAGDPQSASSSQSPADGPDPVPAIEGANAYATQADQTLHPAYGMGHVLPPKSPHYSPRAALDPEMEDVVVRDSSCAGLRPGSVVGQTTSAGLLLTWRSNKALTSHFLERENLLPEDFPLLIEERQGMLGLFGRGGDGLRMDVRLDMNDETYPKSRLSTTTVPGGLHQLGNSEPMVQVDYGNSTVPPRAPPDYDEASVWRYITSFQENILILHPIISESCLNLRVNNFLRPPTLEEPRLPGSNQVAPLRPPGGRCPSQSSVTIGKRKRSPAGWSPTRVPSPITQPVLPSRTINQAIVLAALALGKLSLNRSNIPDLSPPENLSHNGTPITINNSAFPAPKPQSSPYQSTAFSWPAEHGADPAHGCLPGREYLTLATDILGNHDGTTSIDHVHANILVALYYGQIGHVLQSFRHICIASQALQTCMHRDLTWFATFHESGRQHPGPPPKPKREDQPLLLAFWTCLQLESDILAELDLPHSGIRSYEEGTPYPDFSLIDCKDHVAKSYLAQLYIRKQLNYVSNMFYSNHQNPLHTDESRGEKLALIEARNMIRMGPESQLSWLPPEYQFNECDPPIGDILAARLRAKYWGFQVICLRPFIKIILDFSARLEAGQAETITSGPATAFNLNEEDDITKYEAISPEIVKYAWEGINALIESTRAFHGLDHERLLLPNFFGTAIASSQWGNLLVLAACYRDPFLGGFVEEASLKALFSKTISWINAGAVPSSSLAVATRMLQDIGDSLFVLEPNAS